MRVIWSGVLSFGLVNIPVRLYSATESKGLDFNYLHRSDLSPIRYAKICRAENKEVPFNEVVRGFEYTEGRYVVLEEEDFSRADVGKAKTISVLNFTEEQNVDSMYFEKPYFLEPDKGSGRAYALLRQAMKNSNMAGVAKFVLRNREHLGLLSQKDDVIVLNKLRYARELRKPDALNLPGDIDIEDQELELALELITKLDRPFEPQSYHDTYREQLERLIEEKAKGLVPEARGREPEPTEVTDIVARLKASLRREAA